jgi:hypothetical protein
MLLYSKLAERFTTSNLELLAKLLFLVNTSTSKGECFLLILLALFPFSLIV